LKPLALKWGEKGEKKKKEKNCLSPLSKEGGTGSPTNNIVGLILLWKRGKGGKGLGEKKKRIHWPKKPLGKGGYLSGKEKKKGSLSSAWREKGEKSLPPGGTEKHSCRGRGRGGKKSLGRKKNEVRRTNLTALEEGKKRADT